MLEFCCLMKKSVLLFGWSPTLEFLPHSCDLSEIFCPALGGLIPADLPRAFYNQAIRNRLAAMWTSEHECSLETTCCFVNRESFTRCKDSARSGKTRENSLRNSMVFHRCWLSPPCSAMSAQTEKVAATAVNPSEK